MLGKPKLCPILSLAAVIWNDELLVRWILHNHLCRLWRCLRAISLFRSFSANDLLFLHVSNDKRTSIQRNELVCCWLLIRSTRLVYFFFDGLHADNFWNLPTFFIHCKYLTPEFSWLCLACTQFVVVPRMKSSICNVIFMIIMRMISSFVKNKYSRTHRFRFSSCQIVCRLTINAWAFFRLLLRLQFAAQVPWWPGRECVCRIASLVPLEYPAFLRSDRWSQIILLRQGFLNIPLLLCFMIWPHLEIIDQNYGQIDSGLDVRL